MSLQRHGIVLGLAFALLACGATRRGGGSRPDEAPAAGGAAAGGGAGGAPAAAARCDLPPPALVRLSFGELVASARSLFDDDLAEAMMSELGGPPQLAIPALAAPSEGAVFTEATLATSDSLAQLAGRYVRGNFELTGCAEDDFECVSEYVAELGEHAFRRPLHEEERAALLRLVEQAKALGVGAKVAVEYGVYGVFESPHFLYRTELGEVSGDLSPGERRLTDHELASSLAYFVTGAPPDAELLDAAGAGKLTSGEQLDSEVTRLLNAPSSREHLEALVAAHLGFQRLETLVIDPALEPGFGVAARRAMRTELEALLGAELWSGAGVGALLTSRRARIDADLASIYGVTFPPAGAKTAEDGFAVVDLPPSRAGLLTRAGWVTLSARPDRVSVVARGLQLMNLLCGPTPASADAVDQQPPNQEHFSEREKAEYRMETEPCRSCHEPIDSLGLALEDLDMLGRFRSADADGRPIDASTTLPAFAGGERVSGARELSEALPEAQLARCLSQKFLEYALASAPPDHCERDAMAEARLDGDQTLATVISQIAQSRSFRLRSR